MSRSVRNGLIIGILGLGLIAFGIVTVGQILRQTLTPVAAPTAVPVITEGVVVTTHDIALGTVLQTEDLRIAQVPAELVPTGALKSADTAVGKFVKVDLVSGEMVLDHNLANPSNSNQDIGYAISDDQVLMAFPATDLMSSLSVLKRGDQIDIFVTLDQEVPQAQEDAGVALPGSEEDKVSLTFTFDAMQRVKLTAVVVEIVEQENQNQSPLPGQAEEEQKPAAPPDYNIRAYLLAMAPQDALVLKHLKDTGAIFDFVLRSPTSNRQFELTSVTDQYLVDRYELVDRR